MTILKQEFIPRKNNSKKLKFKLHLKCDHCGNEYICPYFPSRAVKQKLHFCNKICSSKAMLSGGALRQRQQNAIFEIYGSLNYVGTEQHTQKMKEVLFEKYGTDCTFKIKNVAEKIKQSNIEKYGQEVYAGSADWEAKLDRTEIAQKAWKTKIKNGSCSKSQPEENLNAILVNKFGLEDIDRQIPIIKQWIDFYIKSIKLYIQVDGVYWHGLNRDIAIIEKGLTTQDVKIYKQIQRDKKLNDYMKENNMKLLRITDDELKIITEDDLISLILEKGK